MLEAIDQQTRTVMQRRIGRPTYARVPERSRVRFDGTQQGTCCFFVGGLEKAEPRDTLLMRLVVQAVVDGGNAPNDDAVASGQPQTEFCMRVERVVSSRQSPTLIAAQGRHPRGGGCVESVRNPDELLSIDPRLDRQEAELALRAFVALCDTHRHARRFIVLPFVIVTEDPSPRFLGLSVSERNRRVASRHGGTRCRGAADTGPSLTVPVQAAITPALFPLLTRLAADRTWHLAWHASHPPLVWRPGPGAEADETIILDAGAVLDVASRAARRASAWRLLRASGKPQDGWLSRYVHRKISRVFSYGFLQLGLSANAATLFAFAIGLLAAYMMAHTSHRTMIAGGLLFWFASIADGIDGEVARVTLSESPFGEQLDTGVDQLTHLSCLVGVLVGWARQGITPGGIALALAVIVGTPGLLLWAMALVRRARATDQFFVPTKPIEVAIVKAARDTGDWGLRATAAIFLLFRREAFSLVFFLLALITGRRVAIPAALAVGLLIVAVTFLTHGRTLARVLRETVGPRPAGTTRAPGTPGSAVPT